MPRTFDLTQFNGMFTRAEEGRRSVMTQRTVVRGPVYTIPKTTIIVNSTFIWQPVCGSAAIRHFHLLTLILLSHARVCVFGCTQVCMYACMCVYIICMRVCFACMCVCMHICIYACIYVYMHTCMHTYMHACM